MDYREITCSATKPLKRLLLNDIEHLEDAVSLRYHI